MVMDPFLFGNPEADRLVTALLGDARDGREDGPLKGTISAGPASNVPTFEDRASQATTITSTDHGTNSGTSAWTFEQRASQGGIAH
jgi:hypothetical protein